MTKGVLIPDIMLNPIRVVDYSSLEDLQQLVGGPIQIIPLPGEVDAYVNELGKLSEHRVNQRATEFVCNYLSPGDYVAGPLLLIGPTNTEGDTEDVPDDYIKLFPLQETHDAPTI